MRNMMCLKTRCDISRIFCDSDNFRFFLPASPLRFLVISRDARNSYYFMESACFLAPPELWSLDFVVNIDDQSTFSFFGWPSMTVPLSSSFFSYFAITTVRKAKPSAARDLEVVMTIVILQVSSTTTIVFFKDTFSITLTPQSIWSRLYFSST